VRLEYLYSEVVEHLNERILAHSIRFDEAVDELRKYEKKWFKDSVDYFLPYCKRENAADKVVFFKKVLAHLPKCDVVKMSLTDLKELELL
jgi:hypothetical protein